MNRDDAINFIEDIANVLSVSIPESIEINGEEYMIKEDVLEGDREKMLAKYQDVYESIREKIDELDDVPDELVKKALILRRAILFLKEFSGESEVEDKKRWIEYIKGVNR